ncbi:MAG: YncE family protein [Gemmatimonadaceae bacterium]
MTTSAFRPIRLARAACGALSIAVSIAATAATAFAQATSCSATSSSMTPAAWVAPPVAATPASRGALHLVAIQDVALPGPANRFDYQSIDPAKGRLYISHMGAGHLLVVDLESRRVIADVARVDRATGVWAVPAEHRVYVSAAGRHELIALDDSTFKVAWRASGIRFPDGIAYAPAERKVFVSDESGEADVVIDARTGARLARIALGGEAGNTHYDSVSHCIVVAVQTRNQLAAIDPRTERVVARYDLPRSDEPHGFAIDEPGRLAFVTGEGNAMMQVVDLRTMRVVSSHAVGADPDVAAWDPGWRRLYIASESGVVSVFDATGPTLRLVEEVRAPHAHTVAVDPRTHLVYLPLENVGGHPFLRIMAARER